jgi:uncharacterized membrane protein (DUF106 family)
MKRLKEQINDYQKKIRVLTKENPKKAMKLQEEAMQVNMQYMGKSLKPMLYTFIPIIFIFGWMNTHYTYAPLAAGQPLTVSTQFIEGFAGQATLTSQTLDAKTESADIQVVDKVPVAKFAVSGPAGKHDFQVTYQSFSYNGSVWFGQNPVASIFPGSGPVKQIVVEYPKVHPLGSFHISSWYPGWLALYILFSIALSMGTRKLMKIY